MAIDNDQGCTWIINERKKREKNVILPNMLLQEMTPYFEACGQNNPTDQQQEEQNTRGDQANEWMQPWSGKEKNQIINASKGVLVSSSTYKRKDMTL